MLIRKKLTADEFSSPFLRYSEDCDCVQFTPDGGETWVDQPINDPRTSDAYRLPPLTGSDIQCRAAEGMTALVRAVVDQRINTDTELEFAGGILGIVAFIPGFNVLWALIIALASFAVTIAREILEAAFTEEVYDQIRCIFLCNIDEDGQMSQEQFDHAYEDLIDLDTLARTWCQSVFNTFGCVGLSDAGVALAAAADCDDCECGWCHLDDFAIDDGGYARYTAGGNDQGTYNAPGGDWVCDPNGLGPSLCDIYKSFTAGTIDKVLLNFSNSNNDGGRPGVILYLSGSQVARIDSTIGVGVNDDLTNYEYDFGGVLADTIRTFNITALGGGTCSYQWIQLSGTGTSPFGADNC